ncbi:MAG: PP2C family protein-serine/threonine phosphatase [Lachnospiraceae bacterium]|nr:PP2C family protein-serine/threonine phosphatase [Lachnospiraceae bacterium]
MKESSGFRRKKTFKQYVSGLSFRIISGTVILLLFFGAIQSIVGYVQFTRSLTREYNEAAFRTAATASFVIDGDRIDDYLGSSGESEEYKDMRRKLDALCQKQDVTLIYLIRPDTDDYGEFTSVVNITNEKSSYDPWPVGYRRETTNEEYRNIYRDIYENGLERGTVIRKYDLRGKEPHITSLIPIKDSAGNVSAILCVQRPMEELSRGMHHFLLNIVIATVLLALISSLFTYFFLRKHFVRPMREVTLEAARFARENSEAEEGALTNISTISEIEVLAKSIKQMERDTLDYVDRLTVMTAENKRIGTELYIAKKIQGAILPNEFPPFPGRGDFDIYASMTPAKEVGGDFYDFFLIDEDHLALVIADVAGKGVPAALFMMIAKLLIKLRVHSGGDLGEMLSDVNGTLIERNAMGLFVTVWLSVLTLSTGEGRAVNAGHENPAIRRKNGQYEFLKYKHFMPLAALDDTVFEEHEFTLEPGDSLLVYTDGVTEATDIDYNLYGEERLLAALNIEPDASPADCIMNVKKDIDDFVGDAEQFDDITMLALRYNGR